MNNILTSAQAQTITSTTGQIFYQLLIPVTISVENSPAQPNLVIEPPVVLTNGLTSSVTFSITGLSTTAIIDKDITFYFTVSGAPAADYTVTGTGLNSSILPDGTIVYSDTIGGSDNHQDSPATPASAQSHTFP